jgi:DNA modification methylase
MAPYYDDGRVVIYHGDALELLPSIETSVDAVLTDPPYASGSRLEAHKSSSGAMLRANTERAANTRFGERPIELDQMTTTGFVWLMRAVANDCRHLLPDGGSFLSFIDWRQWPNLVGALETCNYRVQGMVVWDKGSMGLGNGFRGQHELICHASKGVPVVHDRGCGNVLKAGRVDPVDHPSPKPVGLLTRLIEVVTPPGGLVLDPFMGSGSVARAAADSGRRCIGIEVEERYCEIAANRLSQTSMDFGAAS